MSTGIPYLVHYAHQFYQEEAWSAYIRRRMEESDPSIADWVHKRMGRPVILDENNANLIRIRLRAGQSLGREIGVVRARSSSLSSVFSGYPKLMNSD